METKPIWRSKEVWVGIVWSLLLGMKVFGIEPEGVFSEATSIYVASTPLIMLVIRIFWTKTKLTF